MRVVISALIALCVISCSSNSKKNKSIQDCWTYSQVLKDTLSVKRVDSLDRMCLDKDSTFYYYLAKEMIYATGTWSLKDSTLTLDYDYIPSGKGLDSTVVNTTGLLSYYINGKPVKRLGLALSMTKDKSIAEIHSSFKDLSRSKRQYQLVSLSPSSLEIKEQDVRFLFTR